MQRKGQCMQQAVVSVTIPINRIYIGEWSRTLIHRRRTLGKPFIKFQLDGKDSCGTQECSSWIHKKELHGHGEPDDVDPVVDFRFDIIYRHRDPLTRQVEDGVSINLGNEKGNI